MPFTPSHAVAILPLLRTPLAPAALVIGSMAPDLPYFLPVGIPRDLTHSLVGAPTVDLLIGLSALALWVLVLRAPVLDYSPSWLRGRMAVAPRWRVRGWMVTAVLLVVALELGILSHLLLDLFTHEGGWLDSIAPWAGMHLGTFSAANLIHAGVSIVASVIVAIWVRGWVQRTAGVQRATRLSGRARLLTWIVLLALLALVAVVWWLCGIAAGQEALDPNLLGHSFFVAVAVAGAAAVVLALLWRLRAVR